MARAKLVDIIIYQFCRFCLENQHAVEACLFRDNDSICTTKNYFPLPNCIYQLGLSAGAIAVYGYLLYIENRETYQCHASYATIGNAVGMSRNTVRKYVQELERRGLVFTERTMIVTRDGRTQNGSLLYTILPIQLVVEQFYQEQFNAADIALEQQRIEKLMVQRNAVY